MLQSIVDDIKGQFRYGNKIMQIILVNCFVFLGAIIVKAFSPVGTGFFQNFLEMVALPAGFINVLQRPWTLFTHMILHVGLWHLAFNMLLLYWFGRIVGDLIGDKKILPLYIAGGLFGALFFLLFTPVLGLSGIAYGASSAVMAFVVAAGFLAPEYNMRLILLGDVKLKWIVLVLVLLDVIQLASGSTNPGGSIAHIGGAIFGGLYIYLLQQGTDLLGFLPSQQARIGRRPKKQKTRMTVVHNVRTNTESSQQSQGAINLQSEVDRILDKINASGYDSLSAEDKEILYRASQNKD